MRAPFIILFLLLVLLQPLMVTAQRGRQKMLRSLYNSKDPDKVKSSIENLSELAKNRSKPLEYILYQTLLGDQYVRSNDFVKAEQSYQEAYREAKKNMPIKGKGKFQLPMYWTFQLTVFDPIDRLAYYYLKIGNFRTAEELFNESRMLREARLGERSIHRIHPLIGLGSLSYRRGKIEQTYTQFNEASRLINRAMSSAYDYDILNRLYLNDLAEICLTLGKMDEAKIYIDKLAIATSGTKKFNSKAEARSETARVFEMKARYSLMERDYSRAKYYLDRADYYNPSKTAVSDVRFKMLKTRGLLEWYQGHSEEAAKMFSALVRAYRDHIARNFVAMSEYEKEQFYSSLKKDFDLFNSFVLDQQGKPTAQALAQDMYDNTLNTKALLLNESNRQKNNILESGNTELIAMLKDWEYSKAALSAAYYEETNPQRIDELEKKIDELEKKLNAASGLFGSSLNAISWKNVKEHLKTNEAAAEIIRVRLADKSKPGSLSDSTVYAVLTVTPSSDVPALFVIPNGNQLERRYLSYYRNAIMSRLEDPISYDQFWLPIRRELLGVKTFYLSPDGVYNQINLNTLQNTVNKSYLIDEMELVYLTNTSDLLKKSTEEAERIAVLVGRPSYDFEEINQHKEEQTLYGQRNVISEELQSFKEQEFEDLPGTETEVNIIEPILQQHKLEVMSYKGESALEENVKAVHHPSVLHIATHGFFVDDAASAVSPMIRSGIVLAGVRNTGRSDVHEDGILTAYEATNLDLEGTDLVVLSACQTGLGEVRNGEGVYGLQRAIVVAGAQNLIMSLWKVDDAATADLMATFYKSWTGTHNTVEFRQAQRALRQKYPQPFYWGAFIMLGK